MVVRQGGWRAGGNHQLTGVRSGRVAALAGADDAVCRHSLIRVFRVFSCILCKEGERRSDSHSEEAPEASQIMCSELVMRGGQEHGGGKAELVYRDS